jgi:DNA-directed RNA polymerase subunit RPC12/RpoP
MVRDPMPARHFVCASCGARVELQSAFAEGETPVCCGVEMDEVLTGQPARPSGRRSSRPPRLPREVTRQVRCPRCGAGAGAKCRRDDGSEREASHVERVREAAAIGSQ